MNFLGAVPGAVMPQRGRILEEYYCRKFGDFAGKDAEGAPKPEQLPGPKHRRPPVPLFTEPSAV